MVVPDIIVAAVLMTLGLTLGIVGALVIFVRRQRQALIQTLGSASKQQIITAQQLAAALESVQRQQRQYEQQLQNLAQATLRLRQDVQILNKRTERTAADAAQSAERVLH